jgi:hypothetical protein
MTSEEAEAYLSQFAAYDALTKSPGPLRPMWSTRQVVDWLNESGVRPRTSDRQVAKWASARMPDGSQAIPGARDFGANVGWRLPREGLMIFFAEDRMQQLEASAS